MARTDVGWWDTGCSSYKLRANGMPPGNIGHQDAQSKYECVSIAAALIPNQGSEMNGEIEGGAAPGRSPAPWRVICTGPLIRTRTVRLSLSLSTLPSPHALATRLSNLLGPASDRKGPPAELGQYRLATRSSTADYSLALILAHHGIFLDSPVQLHKAASPDRRSRLEAVPRPRKLTPSRT